MTRKDIDNIISIICPNDKDFEKPIISPAYLKKELEALALEQEPCEDCISREYVIKLLENTKRTRKEITNRIYEVPSVIPHPCEDAISRQAVIDINEHYCGEMPGYVNHEIWKEIKALPSVTPQPKMGAWEWLSYEGIDEGNWHCSECRMIIPRMPIDDDGKPLYKCCPYCGSKNTND